MKSLVEENHIQETGGGGHDDRISRKILIRDINLWCLPYNLINIIIFNFDFLVLIDILFHCSLLASDFLIRLISIGTLILAIISETFILNSV